MTAFRRLLALALFISVSAVHAQPPATTSAPASIALLIPQTVYGGVPDYSKQTPPVSPAAAKPPSAYVGIYRNDYYGQIEVSEVNGMLWMRLPADGSLFPLMHWDGDTFIYRYKEEPGVITRAAKFTLGDSPKVRRRETRCLRR